MLSLDNMDYRERRATLKEFYHSKAWRKVREVALKRDNYLCCRCDRPGEHVHHKIRLTPENVNDPAISLNLDNLETLCHACHDQEHAREHGRGRIVEEENPYTFDENGYCIPKNPPPSIKANLNNIEP